MRCVAYLGLPAAGMAALFCAGVGFWAAPASAQQTGPAGCSCRPAEPPHSGRRASQEWALDEQDEVAALEAIRVALSEVGDGSSYVWHRRYGQLGGLVQPTHSFIDVHGRVCRRIIVILSAAMRSGRIEGTACRLAGGRWQLEG